MGLPRRLFTRGSRPEASRLAAVLRDDTNGGLVLLVSAAVALIWANSPWSDSYHALAGHVVGPREAHLDLPLAAWAADGLLAVFFFVVGCELKREFVAGDLRNPSRAALPILAAVGGMVAPALIFVGINIAGGSTGTLVGWAVPTATDIAFAVAVLAVLGSFLPSGLRVFLLTLAVVDDLLAITVIAFFYTDHVAPVPLLCALVPAALFAVAVQRGVHRWWILLPLAAATWALVHASGIHATVAGVVLGFTVPVLGRDFLRAQVHVEQSLQPRWPEVNTDDLRAAWADILKRAKLNAHHTISREQLSVREHMSIVLRRLQGRRFVEFQDLFDPTRGVPVLVVTFIAMLELSREHLLEVTQAEAFAPIYVRLAYQPV